MATETKKFLDLNGLDYYNDKVQAKITAEKDSRVASDTNLQSQISSLASGSPLVASSTAGMTDTSRVYVNTTDGNWYYYDGDSWEIGGVYQAAELICDTTLTQSGVPADAKAVGDILYDSSNGVIGITTPTITAKEEGKYINASGNISTYAGVTAYSEPIAVKKGDKIVAHLEANSAMCAICYSDAAGNNRTVAVMGASWTVQDYTLTSDRDGYVILCYYMAETKTCTIYHHNFADALSVLDSVQKEAQPVDSITVEDQQHGYYIGPTGNITAYVDFSYSKIIPVSKGDIIIATQYDHPNISAITYVTEDFKYRRPAVVATEYGMKEYTLTSEHTGYISLCYHNNYQHTCKIIRNKVTTSANTNVLKDKFIVWCGDSIMQGNIWNDTRDGWAGRVCDLSDCRMINYGVGGSTICNNVTGGATPTIYTQIETAHTDYPDADYIIFDGGCNDADLIGSIIGGTIPPKFGSFTENDFSGNYDTDTFCGAFETICMHLSQYWLGKHVGYIVPHKMGVANKYDPEHNNYRAYYETAIQICKKWGISVLNMWDGTYLNPRHTWMCDTYNTMTPEEKYAAGFLYADRQHLTSAGYDYESTIVNDWVKSL